MGGCCVSTFVVLHRSHHGYNEKVYSMVYLNIIPLFVLPYNHLYLLPHTHTHRYSTDITRPVVVECKQIHINNQTIFNVGKTL